MSWLYVPGLAASNSESVSLSIISERLAASSVQWRGKPQQPQAWSRRWKQGGFIRLLSGLTCSPLMLDRGVDSFISSLRATHARTTASPGSAPGPQEIASSPLKSAASLRSAGLILSSEKTCRGTRTDSLQPSSRHWKGWATALRQEYSARPKLAIPCGASDCSSWPPAEQDQSSLNARRCGQHQWPSPKTSRGGWERDRYGNVYPTLEGLGENWEGPSVAVTDGSRLTRSGDRSSELLLTGQAMEASSRWSSPKASDPEKAGPNMRGSKGDIPLPGKAVQWITPMASDDGQKVTSVAHQKMLCNQAASFRLPSSPDRPIAGGSMSSTDSPNSNQPSVKRKLNPIFIEALMRWPTGLSGFERQEMAWTRWWQLQLSFLSDLCSVSESDCAQADLFAGVG